MGIAADQLAADLGVTTRQLSQMARQAGVEPLHYVRTGRSITAVYDDDIRDRLAYGTTLGRVAQELHMLPSELAAAILKHSSAGVVNVPVGYRPTR
jgi:hypothetical protein